MSRTMKAAVLEKPESMKITSVPVPEIGDDDVLIKVKLTGICGTDWSIFTGKYSADRLPLIPGHEFCGTLEQVGKNAKGLKVGDKVTADINMSCGHCFYCKKGQKLLCPDFLQLGIHIHGTYAEYVKAPWAQVHKIPEKLSFMEGAFIEPVSCCVHSAKAMNAELGSSVAILGCGLGILHGALARLRACAPVIVIGTNEKRLEIAKRMGADHVVNPKKVDPVAEVKRLTGGRGADYVLESVGTIATYEQAFQMVRPGGQVSAFGITGDQEKMALAPFDLVLKEKKVTASCAGVGNDWSDAITLIEHGRIDPKPMFSMVVPLEDLEWALQELRTNKELIKVFVSPEAKKREVL
ncbi:MAG TPA: alcohol dehydrogenase catalytic domain-containing protein [Anaeromyxobacter sp.]|nr:alcohol dehydrogenase catalytic domain-containing protein [Anaeromyxobacter sp.]